MPLERPLVTKLSMWSSQIQHSTFGDVCLPGVATGGKMGYHKTSETALCTYVWAPKLLFFAQ